MAGEDEHARVLELAGEAAEHFGAIETREHHVEDDEIGLFAEGEFDAFLAVTRGANDGVAAKALEDFGKHIAYGGLVFDDDNSFHANG